MIYQIFNQFAGTHYHYEGDAEGAKVFRQNLMEEACDTYMPQPVGDPIPLAEGQPEYEQTYLPPTEEQIQAAKDKWMVEWADTFTVCQVNALPNGDHQWAPINL